MRDYVERRAWITIETEKAYLVSFRAKKVKGKCKWLSKQYVEIVNSCETLIGPAYTFKIPKWLYKKLEL